MAPEAAAAACRACPAGSYAPTFGGRTCTPCVHGSYAAQAGAAACHLCPRGFTTVSDGAAVCGEPLRSTVVVGAQYALAVTFSLRIEGAALEDVPRHTGVAGAPEDVLRFLVRLDASSAFNVTTPDVAVRCRSSFPYCRR